VLSRVGLAEDIVSDKLGLNLSDLEVKLDIISPEDLTVSGVRRTVECRGIHYHGA
jgi:hypothetical protein